MSKNNEPFILERCVVRRVTPKAVLIDSDELADSPLWIPKSVFHIESEIDPATCERGDEGDVAIEMWFAEMHELVDDEDEEDVVDKWK